MKMRRTMLALGTGLLAALPALLFQPLPGEAQLLEVRQTVHGMDCAPCAYAVERRMGRLDGAVQVELSLNQGFARVRFGDAHGTTLEQVRRAVRDGGFGPREARVRLRGTVVREEGALVLLTPAGERYLLRGTGAEAGTEVTLAGTVAVDPDGAGRWILEIGNSGPGPDSTPNPTPSPP